MSRSPTVAADVDGKTEGVVAPVDGASDMVVDPLGVAAHIKLKDSEAVTCGLGRLIEPQFGDRRKDHAVAEGARRLGDGGTPARVEDLQ
jgi:hypothetical protein